MGLFMIDGKLLWQCLVFGRHGNKDGCHSSCIVLLGSAISTTATKNIEQSDTSHIGYTEGKNTFDPKYLNL